MKRDLISKCFRKWSFWQIYGVMMLGAMGAVLCAVSLLSIFFHGRITHDYIISGSIAGSVVGSMIVVILLHFAKMLQTVEQAYKKSEERFKQIAANAGEWIWEVDISGLYTYSSPMVKEMLGYEQEEIVGKKYFYDFFIPEAREAFKKAVFTAFEEREFMSGFVKSNTHKNGNTVILETRGGPIINEDGSLGGYRGVDTDITKRKESEDALKEYVTQTAAVNKELDDFTYIISHDLKEPLRSINAFSKFILEDYSDRLDEEGQRYLTRIQANSYRMQELIEDLLELSRIDRQKNPVE
ncbi:MAG: PAS domain S-box protein, partial [PVC group bacterium]|nr:PAS domain S-box protein [PVC group bacterium]